VDEASPAPSAAVADGPYVGLRHYVEEDAENFFGRRTESEVIVSNLRAARLTLLYAESGVGKSSLLRAGVTARLRALAARDARERGAPRLVPVVFSSWSEQPTGALIAAIADAIEPFTNGEADFPVDSLHVALDRSLDRLSRFLHAEVFEVQEVAVDVRDAALEEVPQSGVGVLSDRDQEVRPEPGLVDAPRQLVG